MKLWGGRFEKDTDKVVEAFTASISFDKRLYRHDILGSIAHCRMLAAQGIITTPEADQITTGLRDILAEIEEGRFVFRAEREDIHIHVEARLHEKIGEVAGKLHTARSRNDQVVLDLRLYLREATMTSLNAIAAFEETIIKIAEANAEVIMPGYTHLQRAQPILFGHHLLAYFEMLRRDAERFLDSLARVNVCPLGSGALAGAPYPLDRWQVARELGFAAISRNSVDAVADRDFALEFLAVASIAMMHLSRFAEEIILWSSAEFGFVELDDAFTTGSSIMPQKKNPDVAELVRGKTGRVYGSLISLLTTMKGLPLAYNRDLQEDKEPLFDAADTLIACLTVFTGLLSTLRVRADRTKSAAGADFVLATDLADYLVGKGMPFREAHAVVGRLVRHCLTVGKDFSQLGLEEYHQFSPLFGPDVYQITVESSVAARAIPGGTAPSQVHEALGEARQWLVGLQDKLVALARVSTG